MEDYETLSPCMMDILSMRTAPLPGWADSARMKEGKKKRDITLARAVVS